jgi:hypothetical protein
MDGALERVGGSCLPPHEATLDFSCRRSELPPSQAHDFSRCVYFPVEGIEQSSRGTLDRETSAMALA